MRRNPISKGFKGSNGRRGRLLPDTDEPGARRDLVPEGVSNLSSSERQLSLVKLQQALEVEEDSLSCFRPQIAAD